MALVNKPQLTTGLVVVAAALAVGLSIFAVNRTGHVSQVETAAGSSSALSTSATTTMSPITTAPPTTAPPTTTAPTTTAPTTTPPTTTAPTTPATVPAMPAPAAPLTYTVKSGDTLSVIAAWFKLNGYGDLYEANKGVIGANPDLIRPGQTITLSASGVTMGG